MSITLDAECSITQEGAEQRARTGTERRTGGILRGKPSKSGSVTVNRPSVRYLWDSGTRVLQLEGGSGWHGHWEDYGMWGMRVFIRLVQLEEWGLQTLHCTFGFHPVLATLSFTHVEGFAKGKSSAESLWGHPLEGQHVWTFAEDVWRFLFLQFHYISKSKSFQNMIITRVLSIWA